LVLPGSRARIVRCGGRYDPQLVKRSSEWVSEYNNARNVGVPNLLSEAVKNFSEHAYMTCSLVYSLLFFYVFERQLMCVDCWWLFLCMYRYVCNFVSVKVFNKALLTYLVSFKHVVEAEKFRLTPGGAWPYSLSLRWTGLRRLSCRPLAIFSMKYKIKLHCGAKNCTLFIFAITLSNHLIFP